MTPPWPPGPPTWTVPLLSHRTSCAKARPPPSPQTSIASARHAIVTPSPSPSPSPSARTRTALSLGFRLRGDVAGAPSPPPTPAPPVRKAGVARGRAWTPVSACQVPLPKAGARPRGGRQPASWVGLVLLRVRPRCSAAPDGTGPAADGPELLLWFRPGVPAPAREAGGRRVHRSCRAGRGAVPRFCPGWRLSSRAVSSPLPFGFAPCCEAVTVSAPPPRRVSVPCLHPGSTFL